MLISGTMMLRERTKLRNMRIAEAKQKAEARAAMIDISIIGGLLLLEYLRLLWWLLAWR